MNYRAENHSTLVCILLGLDILIYAVQIWLSVPIFFNTMQYSATTTPLEVLNPDIIQRIALNLNFYYIRLASHIIIGIVILAWIYRAHRFVSTTLNAQNLRFTDGATVVYFFIPVANLFMPYRAMRETWLASEHPTEWQNKPTPIILLVWWITFLLQIPHCLISLVTLEPNMEAGLANGIALFAIFESVIALIQILAFLIIVIKVQSIQNKYESKAPPPRKPDDMPQNTLVS
ncbi:DUF4328 domain-containing protein [Bisgaard Taxon 46]